MENTASTKPTRIKKQTNQSPGFFRKRRAGKHTKHRKTRGVFTNPSRFPYPKALRHKARGAEVARGCHNGAAPRGAGAAATTAAPTPPQRPSSIYTSPCLYIGAYTSTRIYVYTRYIYIERERKKHTCVISAHTPKYLLT